MKLALAAVVVFGAMLGSLISGAIGSNIFAPVPPIKIESFSIDWDRGKSTVDREVTRNVAGSWAISVYGARGGEFVGDQCFRVGRADFDMDEPEVQTFDIFPAQISAECVQTLIPNRDYVAIFQITPTGSPSMEARSQYFTGAQAQTSRARHYR